MKNRGFLKGVVFKASYYWLNEIELGGVHAQYLLGTKMFISREPLEIAENTQKLLGFLKWFVF